MENSEDGKRYIIWFLWKQNKSGSEILYEMEKVYGSKCPGKSMVYKWIDRFNDEHSTVDDNQDLVVRKHVPTKKISKLYQTFLIKIDRRVTLRQLEEELGCQNQYLIRF
ncbi:hypothetical protein LOD99_799 [Oopsacas minuta]|uniref:Mos1 transposase HTH domain-containing protein n=1 Tax=Oopsacas minuta TaxID=111878 RepID=A0AAV7JZJ5_9METZ|nr:hypothetical protein LOD99_799 [Oopsacas minuta]